MVVGCARPPRTKVLRWRPDIRAMDEGGITVRSFHVTKVAHLVPMTSRWVQGCMVGEEGNDRECACTAVSWGGLGGDSSGVACILLSGGTGRGPHRLLSHCRSNTQPDQAFPLQKGRTCTISTPHQPLPHDCHPCMRQERQERQQDFPSSII